MHASKKMTDSENERSNLYKTIHKYLRVEIADVVGLAGSTDFTDQAERDQFEMRFKELIKLLNDHAICEEKYIHPLLENHRAQELIIIEEEHQSLDKQLTSLKRNLNKLNEEQTVHHFYLDFTQFQVDYLRHLISEERDLLPILQKHYSDDQLNAATKDMLADMPKNTMINVTKGMLPVMNHLERVNMLRGIKANMPPTVFANFLSIADSVLKSEQAKKLYVALETLVVIP